MKNGFYENYTQPKYLLPIIIILAATVRIIFYMGHVFSDDSYYSQLAISFLEGNYPSNFIGYPIHLARKLITVLTAIGFMIMGKNEMGSVMFPFIFSILSIPLICTIAKEIFNHKIALLSALLLALLPTDIIFATLNFSDLIAAFFINFGIYYLFRYKKEGDIKLSFFAGMYFAISIFAKMSFYYVGILLLILLVYNFAKTKSLDRGILLSIIIPIFMLILEGFIYGEKTGDYLYRLTLVEQNYKYTYYNFFPFTMLGANYTSAEYIVGLLKQIFVENTISVFFRRFYLFIPIIALAQSILLLKKRKHVLLNYWFLGLLILLIGFTTSPLSYRPLDLNLSWYIYPLFFPAIILAASFLQKFTLRLRTVFLIVFFTASILMSLQYQEYFGVEQKNEFKDFLKSNNQEIIFTDHFTKYGIDLIDGYPQLRRTKIVTDIDWKVSNIPPGALIIYNPDAVDELKLQGYQFPLFVQLYDDKFKLLDVIGGYEIYKKLAEAN